VNGLDNELCGELGQCRGGAKACPGMDSPRSRDLALSVWTGNPLVRPRTSRADLDRLLAEGRMGWVVQAVERSSKLTGALNMALGAEDISLGIVAIV
jgi:hypothetical protein